jgi:hypothetical protein
MLAQVAAELERNAVAAGELQVRQAGARFLGQCGAAAIAAAIHLGQAGEAGAATRDGRRCRSVGGEEAIAVVRVARDQCSHGLGHARVAPERRVLGERQLQAAPHEWRSGAAGDEAGDVPGEWRIHHGEKVGMCVVYQRKLTKP